jgi:hypothetical protein
MGFLGGRFGAGLQGWGRVGDKARVGIQAAPLVRALAAQILHSDLAGDRGRFLQALDFGLGSYHLLPARNRVEGSRRS